MTAAHTSDEFEVPLHAAPPAEAVEAVERGNVVYLTRRGQRFAAIESADERFRRLTRIAESWQERQESVTQACRELWASVADADELTKARVRKVIDGLLDAVEEAADVAAAEAAQADPEPAVPAEQVWAELGLSDRP